MMAQHQNLQTSVFQKMRTHSLARRACMEKVLEEAGLAYKLRSASRLSQN